MSDERIQLTEQWGLRKLQLADRSEWALQYQGMDWFRLCEFLPSNDTTSMDNDVRKFAEAIKESSQEIELLRAAPVSRDELNFIKKFWRAYPSCMDKDCNADCNPMTTHCGRGP